jgi:hypothetical protein
VLEVGCSHAYGLPTAVNVLGTLGYQRRGNNGCAQGYYRGFSLFNVLKAKILCCDRLRAGGSD